IIVQLDLMQHRGLITKNHRTLADKLLPRSPPNKRGRHKGSAGNEAYNKRYSLYVDWVGEKALKPRLTKEQFAKKRLGITNADLAGEYALDHRARIDALL